MDRYPSNDRLPGQEPDVMLGPEPDVMFGPEPDRMPLGGPGFATPRFRLTMPGAIAGAFLVTAIAFGAAAVRPAASPTGERSTGLQTATDPAQGADPGADGSALGHYAGGHAADEEGGAPEVDDPKAGETSHDGTDEPKDDEPAEADEPDQPEAPAEPEAIDLALSLADGKVRIDWSACDPDGFRMYKVLRSPDSTITWPRTENDTYVGAVEDPAKTVAVDAAAPGKKIYYRVFALANDGAGGYRVLCQTPVKGIEIPAPEPTEKSETPDEPASATLGLTVSIREGHPYVDWTRFEGDGFDYYKVVRSKNSSVTWPMGEGDSLAGAFEDPAKTAMHDGDAAGGKTWWYRVFAVRKTESGYRVLAASPVREIATPAPEPAPEPKAMGFELDVVEGKVVLHWEACGADSFRYYKVLRSPSPNPSYLPWTDGTQVIGVIEASGTTSFIDADLESGQTWFYRIQSIGTWNGQKVVLGQTAVHDVTVP